MFLNFHGNLGYTNIVQQNDLNRAFLSSIYLKKSTIFILIFRYVVLCQFCFLFNSRVKGKKEQCIFTGRCSNSVMLNLDFVFK